MLGQNRDGFVLLLKIVFVHLFWRKVQILDKFKKNLMVHTTTTYLQTYIFSTTGLKGPLNRNFSGRNKDFTVLCT